jgi:acetylornithine deacetylase/succinyl-diaminopimelate desuccinylase-like protein
VDVVPVDGQLDRRAVRRCERDGFIWGRGTLDDKGSVAMMLAAAIRAVAQDRPPARTWSAVVADEAGGRFGASFRGQHRRSSPGCDARSARRAASRTMEAAPHPIQIAEKHCRHGDLPWARRARLVPPP